MFSLRDLTKTILFPYFIWYARENFICVLILQYFVAEGHTIITLPYRFGFVIMCLVVYLNKFMATETQLHLSYKVASYDFFIGVDNDTYLYLLNYWCIGKFEKKKKIVQNYFMIIENGKNQIRFFKNILSKFLNVHSKNIL